MHSLHQFIKKVTANPLWNNLLLILFFLCIMNPLYAQAAKNPSINNKPLRIAYVEGGYFADYPLILKGIAIGLQQNRLIDNGYVPIPETGNKAKQMWTWLNKNAGGNTLEFVQNAFYSAEWDDNKRITIKEQLIRRVKEQKDIDLIIAVGTWAGQDFSSAPINTPVIVTSVTNPIEAGIILSANDSGKDNLVSTVQLDRYKRQLILFHNIFNFKKLGIAYENTQAGKDMISFSELKNAIEELKTNGINVELVTCTGEFYLSDLKQAAQNLKLCHEEFVQKGVDAVYLTLNNGLSPQFAKDVLAPLNNNHIPTFSQSGQEDVKHGALLSISQLNLEKEGIFAADQIKAIASGKKPREINQIFESIISLTLNLKSATMIGWNPPLELLIAIDEFYQDIQ